MALRAPQEASTAGKGHGKSAAVEVDTANRGVLYVGPSSPFRVLLFAARTLNAACQYRVTLSLR